MSTTNNSVLCHTLHFNFLETRFTFLHGLSFFSFQISDYIHLSSLVLGTAGLAELETPICN